jgi:hypothetical protein
VGAGGAGKKGDGTAVFALLIRQGIFNLTWCHCINKGGVEESCEEVALVKLDLTSLWGFQVTITDFSVAKRPKFQPQNTKGANKIL